MRWEDYPGLFGWVSAITRVLARGSHASHNLRWRGDNRSGGQRETFEGTALLALEVEKRVPEPRDAGGLYMLGKGKEIGSPLELCQPLLDF